MPRKADFARQDYLSDRPTEAADQKGMAQPRSVSSPFNAVLARCPLLSGFSASERTEILSAARTREFGRGEVLCFEGEPVEEILLLRSGCVKTTKFGEHGMVAILGLVAPGGALGAAGLISTGQHTTTAEPVQHCRALVWRAATFRAFLERFPHLYRNMVQIHFAYLGELEERFREMATEMVSRRVARQLARLHDLFEPINNSGEICLSQEELAQMTGTTLFSISRLFTEWEARGLVVARRHSITVRSVDSLRAIAK
jgi:CRP-like cAMP-binding protein